MKGAVIECISACMIPMMPSWPDIHNNSRLAMPVSSRTPSEFRFSLLSSPRSISEFLDNPAEAPVKSDEDSQSARRQAFTPGIPSYVLSPKPRGWPAYVIIYVFIISSICLLFDQFVKSATDCFIAVDPGAQVVMLEVLAFFSQTREWAIFSMKSQFQMHWVCGVDQVRTH